MKLKPRSHVYGIIGSTETPTVDSLAKQIHEKSMKQSATEEATTAILSPQLTDGNNMQYIQMYN